MNKNTVLVLNKNWQAIHVKTPAEALTMMYSDVATGLDVQGMDDMIPLKWNDWIKLPYNENDNYISTVNLKIKIPKIIILCKYDKVPKKRPRFSIDGIWQRDKGICQYTGKKLKPFEGNIDHIIPKSKGGKTDWTNCVLSHKDVNSKKGNRTPKEAGLRLLQIPQTPKELPITFYIKNSHNIKEWNLFLKEQSN